MKKEYQLKERFIIKLPLTEIKNGKKELYVIVLGNGKEIERVKIDIKKKSDSKEDAEKFFK